MNICERCKNFHLHTTIFFPQIYFSSQIETPYSLLMWHVIYALGAYSRQVILHESMNIVLFDKKVKG